MEGPQCTLAGRGLSEMQEEGLGAGYLRRQPPEVAFRLRHVSRSYRCFFFHEDKTKQHTGKGIPNNTEWEPSELWTGSRKSVEYPVALNVFLLIQYCSRQNSRIKSPQCQFLILTLNINLTSKRYLNIFFKGDQTMNSNTNLNSTNQK
jgi:hypothetical protein